MALPTSTTWDLIDFDASNLSTLLSHPDVTALPTGAPPDFDYDDVQKMVQMWSSAATETSLSLDTGVPGNFTFEVALRFNSIPKTFGNLDNRRLGFTVADDAGRGLSIYFSAAGVAVSRVDDFGVVTPIPDTDDVTSELTAFTRVIRIAVDGVLGRAYIAIGTEDDIGNVDYIVPVEATPDYAIDQFRAFALGDAGQPIDIEIRALRLASTLVVPDFPPIAVAGPDQTTPVGQAVRLDGRASFDPEGFDLSYNWIAVDAPFGSQYAAEGAGASTSDDGDADGVTDAISYPIGSLPAWVDAGDVLQIEGNRFVITAHDTGLGVITVEDDLISDNLSAAAFRVIDQDIISDIVSYTPYVLPDVQGLYRFHLIVSDGKQDSEPSEVLVNTTGSRLPYGVEPDMSFMWKALGDEWDFLENRTIFEEAWVAAAQLLGAYLFEVWQYHYNYSIKDAQSVLTRKWHAYRTLIADDDPQNATYELRYGLNVASHDFVVGDPLTNGTTLIVEAYSPGDLDNAVQATINLTATTLDGLLSEIGAGLPTGVEVFAFPGRGTLSAANYWAGPYAYTSGVPADEYTDQFTAGSPPSWLDLGDIVYVKNRRYTVLSVVGTVITVDTTGLLETEKIPGQLFGAEVVAYRRNRIGLRSNTTYFTVLSTGDAAAILGFEEDGISNLSGTDGAIITDRTYFVGDGVDLAYHGINNGDYLSINNGQIIEILDILKGADPMEYQRVLVREDLPVDASKEWKIPGQVVSTGTDFATEGVYPGDLVKVEVYDSSDGTEQTPALYVDGVDGLTVLVDLPALYWAVQDPDRYELRYVGVKRRKAIPLQEDIIGIPALQDKVSVAGEPEFWKENIDYILEPFYRASDGSELPMLQWRDATFIDPNIEPPDVLWAEYTHYTNDPQIEGLFGRLTSFLRDDASNLGEDFNYRAGVAGLMFASLQGPSIHALRVGAQILLGQPFAEADGYVLEVQTDYSPTRGRILIQDDDGNFPSTSEVIRTYVYVKDPEDLTETSGLDINENTGNPWAAGDRIEQFEPIGSGVNVQDYINTPDWYETFTQNAQFSEIQKYHAYALVGNSDLIKLDALEVLLDFIARAKPTYVQPLFIVSRENSDDIDITETVLIDIFLYIVDHMAAQNSIVYDNQDGGGEFYGQYDDGLIYDSSIIVPDEVITALCAFTWAGGVPESQADTWPQSHDITDIDGVVGPPGGTFQASLGVNIPAGNFEYTLVLKGEGDLDGNDVPSYF